MAILLNRDSRVVIQGISGKFGLFHARKMMEAGTRIVAGITPGRGGEWVLDGRVPVFDTLETAVETTGAEASVIFVNPINASDALMEAVFSLIPIIICVTDGIPVHDMLKIKRIMKDRNLILIGPNSPGVFSPGEINVGVTPESIGYPGNVGVISRSGTLAYEVIFNMRNRKIGISTFVGLGDAAISGVGFIRLLEKLENDSETQRILLIDTVFSHDQRSIANYVSQHVTKPVAAYLAGRSLVDTSIFGNVDKEQKERAVSFAATIDLWKDAGITLAYHPEDIPALLNNF